MRKTLKEKARTRIIGIQHFFNYSKLRYGGGCGCGGCAFTGAFGAGPGAGPGAGALAYYRH